MYPLMLSGITKHAKMLLYVQEFVWKREPNQRIRGVWLMLYKMSRDSKKNYFNKNVLVNNGMQLLYCNKIQFCSVSWHPYWALSITHLIGLNFATLHWQWWHLKEIWKHSVGYNTLWLPFLDNYYAITT
jgi:hypothetical protein